MIDKYYLDVFKFNSYLSFIYNTIDFLKTYTLKQ